MQLSHIEAAAAAIVDWVHQTPVMSSHLIDEAVAASVFFKCENLQKVGAFKARGASHAVALLTDDIAAKGVATHSSGNHGAALAYAAAKRGIPAYVIMPSNAPSVKKAAVAAYGATIIECEPTLAARESTLAETIETTGAHFVPPYDDARIIAGQGTAALEFYQQLGKQRLDFLLTPVGGGGLLAGSAVCSKGLHPSVKVIGVEPKGADDAARGFAQGVRVTDASPVTIADGLRTTLGELNFTLIQQQVDDIITVSEAGIVAAMELVWTRMKLVIEPSSAVPLAALMEYPQLFAGKRVGIIISGGNVALDQLPF